MSKIETAVHEQFSRLASQGSTRTTEVPSRPAPAAASQAATTAASTRPNIPFAKVNSVVAQSPSALAGLEVGDEVIQFGTVNWENHDNLRKVAEAVQNSENVGFSSREVRNIQMSLADHCLSAFFKYMSYGALRL